ncbi:MAG: ATP-binding protein, partial [Bacteroidota bacterium]
NMQLGDIIPLLQSIFDQFQAFAGSKKQKLEMILAEEELEMDHDPEKILRIVSNLLSNAIKYTSEEGKVTFEVTSSRAAQDNTKQALILKVKDTGMGIAQEELPYLFDRFYQAGYVQQTGGGTGIGLSLTHELVQLMEGKIEVTSDLGQGSVFTVHLPITRNAEPGHLDVPFQVQGAIFGEVQSPVSEVIEGTDLPVALVVEDNQDIRKYLQFCLKGHYQVELAVNGQEGIEKALESIPEIIISDVMMPERDGFELSEVLKEDIRTSHIPIILLTAKSDVASRIYGLKHGADDYLAKPFNEEELIVRMQNLLQLRQKLQDRYKDLYGQPIENIAEKDVSKEDELMLNLKAILDENLSDPKFDIEELCKQLHISRSTLGRKIKALTGRSLNVYIRSLRLQKAKQLLLTTDLTVKEVGYEVGFFTSTYFSRTYLEEFGETPGKTRENQSI